MTSKQTLTMMCGIPRSGKSTWIKKNIEDEIIVSPDDIRSHIFGIQFKWESEPIIWAMAKSMARMLLLQGKSVIIDATSTTQTARWEWIKLAEDYQAKVRIVWMATPYDECLDRNDTSGDRMVPEEVIQRISASFLTPGDGWGEDRIEIVRVRPEDV